MGKHVILLSNQHEGICRRSTTWIISRAEVTYNTDPLPVVESRRHTRHLHCHFTLYTQDSVPTWALVAPFQPFHWHILVAEHPT